MEFFIDSNHIPSNAVTGHYVTVFVLLSFLIAAVAAYVALSILVHINSKNARSRQHGCILGAVVMGMGIWSMHFTGMIAFKMNMVHSYHFGLTLLSIAIATAFSWVAFRNITGKQLTLKRIATTAPLMGLAIASMHYVGMAAMQMQGSIHYIAWLFWLSIGIAITVSGVAMWLMRRVYEAKEYQQLWQISAAIIMGLAVCGMHYTGMAAAVFLPYADCRFDPNQDFSTLIGSVVMANIIIISLALFDIIRDNTEHRLAEVRLQNYADRLEEARIKAEQATQRLQHIFDHIGEGVYGLDLSGHTIFGNKAAEEMLGYRLEEMLYHSQHELIHHHHADGTPYDKEQCNIYHAFKDGMLHKEDKEVFWRKDGSCFPVEYSSAPMRDAKGVITGAVVIFRNIAERKQVEEKLREYARQLETGNAALALAQQKAEQATQEKSQFIAAISHELRTPMNGILGMVYLLKDTSLEKTQRSYIDTIDHSAQNLLLLINDILDMSKIEANELITEKAPFDIKTSFMQTINLLKPMAVRKGIALLSNIDIAMPDYVTGDRMRFIQIVTNLVGNAIKFTDQGHVEANLRYDAMHGTVYCEIKDTGIGIPESKRAAIFEKFVQGNSSITQKYGGTGLGLAITKRLVVMMGGEIDFESKERCGSRFWFTIPAAAADQIFTAGTAKCRVSAHTGYIKARDAQVLIAEDNAVNRMFLLAVLQKFGFTKIDVAENGMQVMKKIESRPPGQSYDAIFMDCRMPEMDGYETTRRIRERALSMEGSTHIPIIAMTANALMADRDACFKVGMDEYLSKPLQADQLKEVLKRWFIFDSNTAAELPSSGQVKNAAAPMDFERLKMAAQTDQEQAKMLALFFRLAKESIASMEKSRRHDEFPQWKNTAHSLKGAAGNLGMPVLENFCRQAEKSEDFTYNQRTDILTMIKEEIAHIRNYIVDKNPLLLPE